MNPDRSTTRRRTVVAAVVIGAAVLAACGGDGDPPVGTIDRPGVTAPSDGTTAPQPEPTTAPEPQPTPAPEPEPEAPPTEEAPPAEDESLTTEEWIAIGLIVLVVLGALVGIVAFLRRGDDEPGNDSKPQRLADITRASRSIHDSTVIRLLQTTDTVTLQSGWGVAQQQFVDLEQRIAALTAEVGDPAGQQTLQQLGAALAGLRGALSSYVALRVDPASAQQTELVQQSQQSVMARNQQLDAAVNQASYLQP